MTISINTNVAGQFSVYSETIDGNLELLAQSPNMIVNTGMHSLTGQTWAEAFTKVHAGSGTSSPSVTSTAISDFVLSSATFSTNPGSYTVADYLTGDASLGPLSAGVVYKLVKAWRLTNTLSNSATIYQLGTLNNRDVLFSYANINPFVLNPSQFVFVVYELRLYTYTSTLTTNLSAFVPAGDPINYSFGSNRTGVVNVPIATIDFTSSGSTGVLTINKSFSSAGVGMFEPSTSDLYLYKQSNAYDSLSAKRPAFLLNPVLSANTAGAAAPANTYRFYGIGNSKFEIEQPPYNDDFKIKRHILVAPTGSTETIHGFVISNAAPTGTTTLSVPTNLEQRGLHCVFDAPWTRPKDSFLKIYFEHRWARL